MGQLPLFADLAILAGLGAAVTVLLVRLRLPAVAGLLAAGALLGPFGLGLVKDLHSIESLAEVGVVLLLFTIGLEFSFSRLRHIFRQVALGGLVQVVGTGAAAAAVALALGKSPAQAVFWGFVFALSSTAIVLRALSERGELDAPHGRFIVGTLIFQDLCVVPMVLLVPVLASPAPAAEVAGQIGLALGKAALVVAGALFVARLLVPRVLGWVDASRSRELFLLAVLAICVGTAWLTSLAGLSLALGAFLGGMVVADTEFQHRAMGDILPLRDAFVSVFFISLGMLFDWRLLIEHPLAVGLLLAAFVLAKAVLAILAAVVMRFPARAAWLAGIGLAQFGEFGFVLMQLGQSSHLTDPATSAIVLAAGIMSMFLTPVLIRLAPHITAGERMLSPLTRLLGVRGIEQVEAVEDPERPVIIVGYGLAGKLVARALSDCGIEHLVLELNAETVRQARDAGQPVYYADATSPEALDHAHVLRARAAVVLINDPLAANRVVDTLKRVAPEVPVLIRARYHSDRPKLESLGATEVVVEEVEAGVEVIARLLRRLEVPRNRIEDRIHEARLELQTSARRKSVPRRVLPDHAGLADLKVESVQIPAGSPAVGRSPVDLGLRKNTHATIVAVRREGELVEAPDPGQPLEAEDVVYLVGSLEAVRAACDLLGGRMNDPLG